MATSSDTSDQNNVKSRRPAESAFKQQRLPAWQPILTAGTVLPTFFVIGIAFIPVGIGLLYFSDDVTEYVRDYTFCVKKDGVNNITCADYIKQTNMSREDPCICELTFNLTEDFKADVYFYYGLSNYYQNHRRYVKSRDDNQLLGRLDQPLSTDCEPFLSDGNKPIAPCGAIANSLFNDTLTLWSVDLQTPVPVNRTGIAWSSDKEIKFRNPKGDLRTAFANFTKPSNWAKHVWQLDEEIESNNGFQNEDLIVWMRTAALPTFRKLYRRVDHNQDGFRKGLSNGLYTLTIEYNYPVTDFDGRKSFIISTTSLLGGKNPFLGVAYIVVGTLCLLLGIVLLIIHVRCSKRYYPTPTESLILEIDAMPRRNPSDRRLENLRAINLAYSASNSETPTVKPLDDDELNPSVHAMPNSNPTKDSDTEKTYTSIPPQPTTKESEAKIEISKLPKHTTSTTKKAEPEEIAKPKKLHREAVEYNAEERIKLEKAAKALEHTEASWDDYAKAFQNLKNETGKQASTDSPSGSEQNDKPSKIPSSSVETDEPTKPKHNKFKDNVKDDEKNKPDKQ